MTPDTKSILIYKYHILVYKLKGDSIHGNYN